MRNVPAERVFHDVKYSIAKIQETPGFIAFRDNVNTKRLEPSPARISERKYASWILRREGDALFREKLRHPAIIFYERVCGRVVLLYRLYERGISLRLRDR